jgi:hypothetical protein
MHSNRLTMDTIVRRNNALLSTSLGDDVVMMDVENGTYYGLEEVAARVWALAEQPVSVRALCEMLTVEYRVSPAQCEKEIVDFLSDLIKHSVVETVTAAGESAADAHVGYEGDGDAADRKSTPR